MLKKWIVLFGTVLIVAALIGCGDAEEKKMKFFNKGQVLYEEGDYVKARLEFKNALQIDPKFARGYHMLGLTEQKTGNFKNAYAGFKKAAELDETLLDAQLELGKLLFLGGEADKAMEKIGIVLAKNPDDSEALILKASVLLARKDYDESVKLLQDLKAGHPNKPDIYLLMASASLQQEDLQKAESEYRDGIAANPDSVVLHLALAKFYNDSRRFSDAADVVQRVIELQPDNVSHRLKLANLYWIDGRTAEADKIINEVVAKDPADEDVRLMAARYYQSKTRFNEAEQMLLDGIEQIPESFQLRLVLAEVYVNQRKPDDALETLEACLTLDDDPANPGIVQTKIALAKLYFAMRKVEEAERYVDEVIAANPKSVDGHFYKGNIYLSRGDGLNAISKFRTVVNERPGFVEGYTRLAAAHMLNKEPQLAEDTLQNALKVAPKSKEARRALARIYAYKKDYPAAEKQLRKIVELDPNDAVAQAALGDLLLAQKDALGAQDQYRAVKKGAPNNALGYLKMGQFYATKNEPLKALSEFEQGYRQNPQSVGLLTGLVQMYIRQGQADKAIALCQQRIQKNPKDVFAYNMLGMVQGNLKNYKEAEAALARAIEIQPTWPPPHTNLANLYLAQGKKQAAIDKFENALATNPGNAAAYMSLGSLYLGDGDYQDAIAVYERALEANPDFWFAANNLAFLLSEFENQPAKLKQAQTLAEGALKSRPNDPAILDTLAWVYYKMEDYQQARAVMEEAIAAAPDTAIFNYHMGMIMYQSGQKEAARDRLEKALEGDEKFIGRDAAERTLKELS